MRQFGKLAISGSVHFAGKIFRFPFPDDPAGIAPVVLYYHRVRDREGDDPFDNGLAVSRRNFEDQVRFLAGHFRVLPLDELVLGAVEGRAVRPRSVAITFDDGYKDNFDYGYPILSKYKVPATIFLATGFIGTDRVPWWDRLVSILNRLKPGGGKVWNSGLSKEVPEPVRPIVDRLIRSGRRKDLARLFDALNRLGQDQSEVIIAILERIAPPAPESRPGTERLFMNWDEAREMSRNGIGFGSHTHNHRILPELGDAEIEFELEVSRRMIEEQLGTPVQSFSYPDGRVDDRSVFHVERAGYRYAVQTYRRARAPRGLFDIPRRKVKELHSVGPCGGFSKSLFHLEITGMGDRLFRRRT